MKIALLAVAEAARLLIACWGRGQLIVSCIVLSL